MRVNMSLHKLRTSCWELRQAKVSLSRVNSETFWNEERLYIFSTRGVAFSKKARCFVEIDQMSIGNRRDRLSLESCLESRQSVVFRRIAEYRYPNFVAKELRTLWETLRIRICPQAKRRLFSPKRIMERRCFFFISSWNEKSS